jgi:hypothetical protein
VMLTTRSAAAFSGHRTAASERPVGARPTDEGRRHP